MGRGRRRISSNRVGRAKVGQRQKGEEEEGHAEHSQVRLQVRQAEQQPSAGQRPRSTPACSMAP